jgi:hypothetical protein
MRYACSRPAFGFLDVHCGGAFKEHLRSIAIEIVRTDIFLISSGSMLRANQAALGIPRERRLA